MKQRRRMDQILSALQSGIKRGDPRSIEAAMRIIERRAKIFGLLAVDDVS